MKTLTRAVDFNNYLQGATNRRQASAPKTSTVQKNQIKLSENIHQFSSSSSNQQASTVKNNSTANQLIYSLPKENSTPSSQQLINAISARDNQVKNQAPPAVVTPKSAQSPKLNSADQISLETGFLGPISEKNLGRKTLVLDLDETLVHSSFKPPEQSDIVLPVDIEGKICYVYVLVRPGTVTFLEELAKYYEVVIYTASLSKYAEPLMKILDQNQVCATSLFREHCTFFNGIFVKDLTQLGRNLQNVIIIDNSPSSYLFQPENALPILSWYDDKEDQVLYQYIPFLKELSDVEDVRPFLMASVKDNQVDIEKGMLLIKTYKEQNQQNQNISSKQLFSNNILQTEATTTITSSTLKQDEIDIKSCKENKDNTINNRSKRGSSYEVQSKNKQQNNIQKLNNGWINEAQQQKQQGKKKSESLKPKNTQKIVNKGGNSHREASSSAKRFIIVTKQKIDVQKEEQKEIENVLIKDKFKNQTDSEIRNYVNNHQIKTQFNQTLQAKDKNHLINETEQERSGSSCHTTPQQTPDLENIENPNVKTQVISITNYSNKTKLISEINTGANSLTRDKNQAQSKQQNTNNILVLKPSAINQFNRNSIIKETTNPSTNTTNSTNTNEFKNQKKQLNKNSLNVHSVNLGGTGSSSLNKRSSRTQVSNFSQTQQNSQDCYNTIKVKQLSNGCVSIGLSNVNNNNNTNQLPSERISLYDTTQKSSRQKNTLQQSDQKIQIQTPQKYQSVENRRNLESQCGDIGKEGSISNLVQQYSTNTNKSDHSANRTPKSDINQPGKIFNQPSKRAVSSPTHQQQISLTTSQMYQTNMKSINEKQIQPKIMNYNNNVGKMEKNQSLFAQFIQKEGRARLNMEDKKVNTFLKTKQEQPTLNEGIYNQLTLSDQKQQQQNSFNNLKINSPKGGGILGQSYLDHFKALPSPQTAINNLRKVFMPKSQEKLKENNLSQKNTKSDIDSMMANNLSQQSQKQQQIQEYQVQTAPQQQRKQMFSKNVMIQKVNQANYNL